MSEKVHSAERNFDDALEKMQEAQREAQKTQRGGADSMEELVAREAVLRQRIRGLRQAYMMPENSQQ
jgi:peptidoglycan hydrolase CwlO-like protein